MTKKVQNIINILKANQNELYADGAFQYFIDNKIDVDELRTILSEAGITLPKEFYELPLAEQKRYRRHVSVLVNYSSDNEELAAYQTFNSHYFYDLVEHARKTIHYTDELIKYVYDLEDINLLFLGMQNIKIKNTRLRIYDSLMEYADSKGINDLYELTIDLMTGVHIKKEEVEYRNLLVKLLNTDKLVGIDLNDVTTRFFFLVENLLHDLPRKEANTLKIKFLILSKEHLRAGLDYNDIDKPAKWILKDYKSRGFFNRTSIRHLNEHVKKYPDLLEGINPNGYMAFYYAFIADEEAK